jgi:hypothetical protein
MAHTSAFYVTHPLCALDVINPIARVETQRVARVEVMQPVAVASSQPVLRVLVYRSVSGHPETVTDGGTPVTYDGEEVWVMVPDA